MIVKQGFASTTVTLIRVHVIQKPKNIAKKAVASITIVLREHPFFGVSDSYVWISGTRLAKSGTHI